MFKKPKRNFRARRVRNSESEEEHEDHGRKESEVAPAISVNESKSTNDINEIPKQKSKSSAEAAMLSFGDEEDGLETFKIKKSSHSKRIAKQIKKESKKEKEEREKQEKQEREELERKREAEEKLRLQRSQSSESDRSNSPNGHLSYSGSEDSDSEGEKKNLRPFQSVLQTGQIPDAHMIHMARMRRQKAREQQDFIPLEEEEPENAKSRLIREDDHDYSDDEGNSRLKFAVDNRDQELRKMHKTLHDAMKDEEGSDHENTWEEQQIRKGVNILMANPASGASENNGIYEQYPHGQTGGLFNSTQGVYNPTAQPPKVDLSKTLADMQNLSISDVSKSMKERLEEVTSVYRTHVLERDSMESRFEQCQENIEKCEIQKPRFENQYKFYQEMKVYVRNIVECLNEKVPQIDYLERCMHHLLKGRTEKFIKRRQEDVKDQSDENAAVGKTSANVIAAPNPERQRRAAEREARRNRRRRKRESQGILRHDDGMSTDDEENNSDLAKYATERGRILEDSLTIFDDVNEDFYDLSILKRRFEEWGRFQNESYEEAYIALCLPKLFAPYIKLALIDWNPLEEGCGNFEESTWFENLMFYGCKDREDLQPDNDIKLIPSIIEKVLLPKLTVLVETVWDPMSSSQTLKLIRLVQKLLTDYPTVNHESKSTQVLMTAIHTRLKKTLDDDVFVPLYSKQVLENKNQGPYLFFQRQFWTCVKLLGNIFSWHGLLSDTTLMELGLDSLLNRYMVLSLLNSPVNNDTIYKCQQVTSTLPKSWFKDLEGNSTLPQLKNLCRYLESAAATLNKIGEGGRDSDRKEARESIKQISKLLVNIHATDHALNLSNQFSFKL